MLVAECEVSVRSFFASFKTFIFIFYTLLFFSLSLFSLLPPPLTPVFSFSLFSAASFVLSLCLSSAAAAPLTSSLYRKEQKERSEKESEKLLGVWVG